MQELDFNTFIGTYNELYKENDEVYHRLARHFNLSDTAFWILYILREAQKPVTQAAICARLYTSKQTVHSALKSLVEQGYLRMEGVADNLREKNIFLTPEGLALCDGTTDRVFAVENRVFDRLLPEERKRLLELETKYLTLLREESLREMQGERNL